MLEWSAHTNFRFMPLQIAKLCIIPVLCILEILFDKVRYSRNTKLSIVLVLVGVAVCTVTDVSVNSKGLLAAVIAVWSTALQQHVSIWLCTFWRIPCPSDNCSVWLLFKYLGFWMSSFSSNYVAYGTLHLHIFQTVRVNSVWFISFCNLDFCRYLLASNCCTDYSCSKEMFNSNLYLKELQIFSLTHLSANRNFVPRCCFHF